MTVAELIAQLQKLPQDAEVYTSECAGCAECNPDGITDYHQTYDVTYRDAHIHGFHKPPKKVVVI